MGDRGERGAVPRGGGRAGPRRRPGRVPPRGRGDLGAVEARGELRGFSLAQLIARESVSRGRNIRMYFPVELVLMVKSLITFEGVGHMLLPGFDVAEVSRSHVRRMFIAAVQPAALVQQELRGAPDLVDALVKVPSLVTEGLRVLERTTKRPPANPFAGLRATLIAAACLVAGAILIAFKAPWPYCRHPLRDRDHPRGAEVTDHDQARSAAAADADARLGTLPASRSRAMSRASARAPSTRAGSARSLRAREASRRRGP